MKRLLRAPCGVVFWLLLLVAPGVAAGLVSRALGAGPGTAALTGLAASGTLLAAVVLLVCTVVLSPRLARRRRWAHPDRRAQLRIDWAEHTRVSDSPWDIQEIAPSLSELREVIGVEQTLESERTSLTILSLESYTDGFLLAGRLLSALLPVEERVAARPVFGLSVRDDRGGAYRIASRGATRGNPRNGKLKDWRFWLPAVPPLDAAAKVLTITVRTVRWESRVAGAEAVRVYELPLPWNGWTVEVSLPAPG